MRFKLMCPLTDASISSSGELFKNEFQSVLIEDRSANWPFVMSHGALVNLPGQRQDGSEVLVLPTAHQF